MTTLETLTAGDFVFVHGSAGSLEKRLIDSISPTRRFTVAGTKYNSSGREINGPKWWSKQISPFDEERWAKYVGAQQFAERCRALATHNWAKEDALFVDNIYSMLDRRP